MTRITLSLILLIACTSTPITISANSSSISAQDRAKAFFLEHHVNPYVEKIRNKTFGTVEINSSKGKQRIGPEVYVECELYDISYFLIEFENFGFKQADPIVQTIWEWFYSHFDQKNGYWPLWSTAGCLHLRGILVLKKFNQLASLNKAWDWYLKSPGYHNPGFIGGRSMKIVPSWAGITITIDKLKKQLPDQWPPVTSHTLEMSAIGLYVYLTTHQKPTTAFITKHLNLIADQINEEIQGKSKTYEGPLIAFHSLLYLTRSLHLLDKANSQILLTSVKHYKDHLDQPMTQFKNTLNADIFQKGIPPQFRSESIYSAIIACYLMSNDNINKSLNADYTPEPSLVNYLLKSQRTDGGWHFSFPVNHKLADDELYVSNLDGTATIIPLQAFFQFKRLNSL